MIYRFVKRVFDLICALIGIIGTSPLWIIGIVGILLSDWGPIFYTAHRIGKDNKPFKMYKFRSMKVLKTLKKGAEASLRPNEDRIFPFGHFIRKVKIDELPQLLNILNGTMSMVGPRPVAQDQFDMFRYGKWNEAARVPVGLSGPAALYDFIYGDQITDEKEYMEKVYPIRRELEYTYVQKAGIFYDLQMVIYTVICILYAVFGKECTWMLNEFVEDAKKTMNE
ncbi:sugar transferase [Bacteroides xylanisolvens]|uniref:sugar transferase n=1 Tax=Bacteroides xylanisolvens TaxID=371601 RepID=UPI001CDD7E71|nr:sugar transferase [Bacteroides xylanisolvens]MCA4563342.1 sugar transferase [Bacteroides xylanisolvens]